MVIQSNVLISHLGMAHVIVTNLCVWFKFILEETFESAPDKIDVQSNQLSPTDSYNFTSNNPPNYMIDDGILNRMNRTPIDLGLLNFTLLFGSNSNEIGSAKKPAEVETNNQTSFNITGNQTNIYSIEKKETCLQVTDRVYNIAKRLSPFLHPCTIEYSIMAGTMFYLIWKNIGKIDIHKKSNMVRRYSLAAAANQIFHLDCNRTLKGLFLGILVILFTIIVTILFVVASATEPLSSIRDATSLYSVSLYITESLELMLLVVMLTALLQAFIFMRNLSTLPYKEHFEIDLEEALEIFGLFGMFSFSVFRILAFRFATVKSGYSYILLTNGVLSIFLSILQTVFILFGHKKRCLTGSELKEKPGREQITFLIMANLSLWLLHTMTRSKYTNILFKNSTIDMITTLPKFEREHDISLSPDLIKAAFMNETISDRGRQQSAFMTPIPQLPNKRWLLMKVIRKVSSAESRENAQAVKWIIINTISYPLLLYFHFHSSSCLSTMWKICYC